jgi:hypothetical protein
VESTTTKVTQLVAQAAEYSARVEQAKAALDMALSEAHAACEEARAAADAADRDARRAAEAEAERDFLRADRTAAQAAMAEALAAAERAEAAEDTRAPPCRGPRGDRSPGLYAINVQTGV